MNKIGFIGHAVVQPTPLHRCLLMYQQPAAQAVENATPVLKTPYSSPATPIKILWTKPENFRSICHPLQTAQTGMGRYRTHSSESAYAASRLPADRCCI
jgi:hypothetical protein